MSVIRAQGVVKRYGETTAVDGADLSLEAGRITCLLGPSGCGKSTLLRLIAGLERPDQGRILAEEHDLTAAPPEARGVGMVFQDYALFPHLRVGANVAFGLDGLSGRERRARALSLLESVRLASRIDAWPAELSGGEQQRVALARALARSPRAVLLDEPFSGLDGHLKAEVRDAALAALRASGAAVLVVTHDAEEAMLMADDLALMSRGRILQTGAPQDCYLDPVSIDAARLLGPAEVLTAQVSSERAETAFGPVPAPGLPDGPAQVMIRPEGLVADADGVEAEVSVARFCGGGWRATLTIGQGAARARLADRPGARIRIGVEPGRARVFPG